MDCTFCGHKSAMFMDFGKVALAGAFLKPDKFKEEKKYRLELYFCENCGLVEVGEKIPPDILFNNYFYSSSTIPKLRNHFREYAYEMRERFNPQSVLEIGCNDGVMLEHLDQMCKIAIGVDPADIVNPQLNIINDFFSSKVAEEVRDKYGQLDLVIANNVFAHIQDIHDVTKGIQLLLKDSGVFVFEVHSLLEMVKGNQYDWVYHEHLYYYSLQTLEKHFANYGMKIFNVEDTKLHAGSRRYYVCKNDRQVAPKVEVVRSEERALQDIVTFKVFAQNALYHKIELTNLLNKLKSEGKKIVGWGACGRANTMIQYCNITQLEYIIDDSQVKHTYYTPGSHYEVKPYSERNILDVVLLFAWSFHSDIIRRCPVDVIIPLPNIHIKERI